MGGGSGLVSNASKTANANAASTAAATGGLISNITPNVDQSYNAASGVGTNLAATGGFTPAAAQQFTEQATSGATADYNILGQQAQQQRTKTGGLGSGGEISQMARQLTQAQDAGTLNAETSLNTQENANKEAGAGIESGLYGQSLQSILQAMGINVQSQGQQTSALTSLATSPASNTPWYKNMWGSLGITPGQLATGGN